jgi:hypothetical protein
LGHLAQNVKTSFLRLNATKKSDLGTGDDAGILKLSDLIKDPPIDGMDLWVAQGTPATFERVLNQTKKRDLRHMLVDISSHSIPSFVEAVSFSPPNKHHRRAFFCIKTSLAYSTTIVEMTAAVPVHDLTIFAWF